MPIYMKYEGIEGSVTGKYKGWIELESCQLGPTWRTINPTRAGVNRAGVNRARSTPSISEITVTKFRDVSSVHLHRESLLGKGKKVTIDFVKSADFTFYLSLQLENTMISNWSFTSDDDHHLEGARVQERILLNFTKITYNETKI